MTETIFMAKVRNCGTSSVVTIPAWMINTGMVKDYVKLKVVDR